MANSNRFTGDRQRVRTGLVALCMGVSALLGPGSALAQEIPVMLQDRGEDACGYGQVFGLNPNGDGFLAVRQGPSTGYSQIDSLFNGDPVATCDRDGRWIGIVYGGADCASGSPPAATQNGPYEGPCRSGWVFDRYVRLIAG